MENAKPISPFEWIKLALEKGDKELYNSFMSFVNADEMEIGSDMYQVTIVNKWMREYLLEMYGEIDSNVSKIDIYCGMPSFTLIGEWQRYVLDTFIPYVKKFRNYGRKDRK